MQRTSGALSWRVSRPWRSILLLGTLLFVLGLFGIVAPATTALLAEKLIAVLLLAGGAAGSAVALSLRGVPGWRLMTIVFLGSLLLGIFLLFLPETAIKLLAVLLVMLFSLEGITSIIFALALRTIIKSWRWLFLSGLSSLIIAVLILFNWPGSATWVIGMLVGINFLLTGLTLILLGLTARTLRP